MLRFLSMCSVFKSNAENEDEEQSNFSGDGEEGEGYTSEEDVPYEVNAALPKKDAPPKKEEPPAPKAVPEPDTKGQYLTSLQYKQTIVISLLPPEAARATLRYRTINVRLCTTLRLQVVPPAPITLEAGNTTHSSVMCEHFAKAMP